MNEENKELIDETTTLLSNQSQELFHKDTNIKINQNTTLPPEETTLSINTNLFHQETDQIFPETKYKESNSKLEANLPKTEASSKKTQKTKKSTIIISIILAIIALILFITRPYIKLNGEKEIIITYNTQYEDAGYKKNKNKDIEVIVENNVDTTKLGEYKVVYKVKINQEIIETKTRIVKVVDNKAPTIKFSTEQAILLYDTNIDESNYDTYVKLFNIEITDNYDKEIDFTIDHSEFNKTKEGKHTIYVSSQDSNGNKVKKAFVIDYHKIHVNSLTLNTDSLILYLTNTATIKAIVEPTDAYDSSVTWETSDRNIASVDKNGTITPEKEGEVTICAKANDTLNQKLEPQELKACATVTISATPKQRFIHHITTKEYYKKISNNVYKKSYGGNSNYGEEKIDLNNYTYERSSANSTYNMSHITNYNYKTNIMTYTMKWGSIWINIKWNINTQKYSWQSNVLTQSAAENYMESLEDEYEEFNEMLKEIRITRDELINSK